MSVQTADEEYYITCSYLLELASRSHELFMGSEQEEKRLLLKMTLQNATLNGTIVDYDLKKPFDSIFSHAQSLTWLENRNTNITTQLSCIYKALSDFRLAIVLGGAEG